MCFSMVYYSAMNTKYSIDGVIVGFDLMWFHFIRRQSISHEFGLDFIESIFQLIYSCIFVLIIIVEFYLIHANIVYSYVYKHYW